MSTTVANTKIDITVNPIFEKLVGGSKVPTSVVETLLPVNCVLYIHYPVRFKKNLIKNQTLLDFGSKVNVMIINSAYFNFFSKLF